MRGSPQRGQGMKCGMGCFITWARRMAERDFDCFLLGTAMLLSSSIFRLSDLQVLEGAELGGGEALLLLAVTGGGVAVAPADRADPLAVGAAERPHGDGQQDLVADLRAEIDLAAG